MKHLFLISFILFSNSLFADDKKTIVLLTSLTHKKINIEAKLEKIFKRKLKNYPFDLKVIHRADQQILSRELTQKENDAVFWVSHGAFIGPKRMKQSAGVSPVSMILDYNRDNVAPVFQKVHPAIQFLGIIGCNSKQILETYKTESLWKTEHTHAPLEYISKVKSIATLALKRSIRKFTKAWKYKRLKKSDAKFKYGNYPITIKRTIPVGTPKGEIRSLRVMNNGHFLGIIDKTNAGETIQKTFYLSKKSYRTNSSFQIELNTGESVYKEKSQIHFGKIKLTHKGIEKWKVFAKKTGEAFGVNKRIFLFKN